MFCPNCNSPMNNNTCPSCGTVVETSASVARRSKSKMLAILLYWLGVGDFYLGYPKRFWKKMGMIIYTLGIGYIVLYFSDLFGVITGRIDCDANGVPLK